MNDSEFKQFVRQSVENNTPLDWAYTADPRYNSVLAEIQQESDRLALSAGLTLHSSESQPTDSQPDPSEGVSDVEILRRTIVLMRDGATDAEVKTALLKEFEDIEQDADEFIKNGRQKFAGEVETAQIAEDEARKFAMEATDKRLEAEREADKHLVEKYQIAGRLDKSIDTNDKERAAKLIRMHEEEIEKEAEKEETFDDAAEELFPECPIFPGALTDLARVSYPSLPLELKQWGLITRWGLLRSGLDSLEFEQHLQPRFYTVMVAYPNRGKTAAINESRKLMEDIVKTAKDRVGAANNKTPTPCVFSDAENIGSADSGPFLVQKFFEKAKETSKQYIASVCSDDRAKVLLDPDELSDVFQKARTSNSRVSTLFTEFLKLHSNNRTANGTKQTGERPVNNAHLAILAGATVSNYPTLWVGTGSGGDGLMSRFLIITTNVKQMPAVPLLSDFGKMKMNSDRLSRLVELPAQTIRVSQDAGEILTKWWGSVDTGKQSATRILETVKQLLIVLAVTNLPDGHTGTTVTVGTELVQHAIRFGEYEMAVRELLNPTDSWSAIQAMENGITEWMRKHASRRDPKTRNDCRRGFHPQRKPGGLGSFLIAWGNCVTSNVLKVRDKTQREAKFSL